MQSKFWNNFLIMYNKEQFEVERRLMSIAMLDGPLSMVSTKNIHIIITENSFIHDKSC